VKKNGAHGIGVGEDASHNFGGRRKKLRRVWKISHLNLKNPYAVWVFEVSKRFA